MLSLLIFTACSERNLEIGFLSKSIQGKTEFSIDNVIGEGDMLPDAAESSIVMEVSCSKNVSMVEVQNPVSKEWKKVTDFVAGTVFDCSATGKVSLSLPLEHVAPYVAPTSSGDRRQDFQIRWFVKNLEGETSVYYRTLSAFFQSPAVTLTAGDVNIAAANAGYTVNGTCSVDGGIVYLTGPFADTQADCGSGHYSVQVNVNSNQASGAVAVHAKHQKGTQSRTYAESEKSVNIDMQAPALSFSNPTEGKVFSSADVMSSQAIHIEGACSETMMPVQIFLNDSKVVETTCSAAMSFAADVVVPEGAFQIKAKQTDSSGNLGESAVVNLQKDTTPPGAFSITGVRSQGVEDSTIDNILTAMNLRVDLGSATDAVSYEVFVKDSTGATTICPVQSNSTSYVIFSSCALQNNTTYKVYAQAKDSLGNVRVTENNGFSFTTQFPVPTITKIYSDVASNATYKAGQSVPVYIEFSRAISFSGAPTITLNSGATVSSPSLVNGAGGATTLRFSYVVGAGQDARPLALISVAVSGGQIYDANNSAAIANLNFTDTGSDPNFLKSRNIKIDAKSPGPVTSLSLGPVPARVSDSPTVSFGFPTDPDPLSAWIRIVRVSDSVEMVSWGQAGSGAYFNMSGNASLGTTYRVEVKLKDPVGNESTVTSVQFNSFSCPIDFTYVFNPAGAIASPFCVGRFEAKGSTSAPQFVASGSPIVGISQMVAIGSCTGKGTGYDLISNQEWNTVADLIRQRPENWTGGVVESGILHRGNMAVSSGPVAAVTGDPCSPADATLCANSAARRVSYLPYAQEIWDFAGNAWEVAKDIDSTGYLPNYGFVVDLASTDLIRQRYGTTLSCGSSAAVERCGYGYLDFASAGPVIWRGGAAYNSITAPSDGGNRVGVFAAKRTLDAAQTLMNGGYRCVFHP
nr:Ig-like domain-containing protein [uncultured Bdellovibrio sp.]